MISYDELIALPKLIQAWEEFRQEKTNKRDMQLFARNLEDNLFALHTALKQQTYHHGGYEAFWVQDPKRRHIHKACVTDRVVHHLLYTYLYGLFDPSFIYDSYSCRLEKGTHKGVRRLVIFTRKASRNYTKDSWALQFDIAQFFASADHGILKTLLRKRVTDERIFRLLSQVVDSFHSFMGYGKGIPLGNLTSQVFANIYLHELDYLVKHVLNVRWYIRYADDGVIVSPSKQKLLELIKPINNFLRTQLLLFLHPRKVTIRKLSWGIDFLGYIVLPHYVLPQTKTKRRMFSHIRARLSDSNAHQMVQSYLGYLSHASAHEVSGAVKHLAWKASQTPTNA